MKNILLPIPFLCLLFFTGCANETGDFENTAEVIEQHQPTHLLVESARKQIGVVTKYDTDYYSGGYPPKDRGACTDVVEQALNANGYDLKSKIDADMEIHPERYIHESDPNINYRRVRNVKVFLDYFAESLTIETDSEHISEWMPGDIVTYDQIPGSLWHIAIVSDKKNSDGIPFLIHNYSFGVVENDKLTKWPAPISGHYRIKEI
jgi:uncharacterized protein